MLSRLVSAALLGVLISSAINASAQTPPPSPKPPFPEIRLPRHGLQGEEAINALGTRLPEVAAHYRKSPEELRAILRRDKHLALDDRGRLFYTCYLTAQSGDPGSETNSPPPVAQLFPLTETFLLHSRPGATKTIFLDFDGHTLSGNAWTANNNGGGDIVAPAWDIDGDPTTFSSTEQTRIQQVWFRVAEDFAPYDVDVTTEYPGEAALTRANSGDQVYGTRALVSAIGSYFGNPGGIAYVGVFDNTGDYYKPALVFPENLGNSEKNIAEAISHEVGHNLGLSHDGTTTGSEYYGGQGNWGPIMGVSYSRAISQWSKGEYANANNAQDDLTVITQNGLTYRADDHGNTIATARALAGTSITTNGVIERTTDVDFFSFPAGAGTAQITVTPSERGANLHLRLSLYETSGTLLTNREVADTSSGVQPVSLSALLTSGTYYVAVEGLGSGDPLTSGYSDYASLGQYSVTITLPGSATWLPILAGGYSWSNTANWASGFVPNTADVTANVNNNILGPQTISLDGAFTVGRLVLGASNPASGFTIQDGAGGPLTFDVVSGSAALIKTSGANDVFAARIALADDLTISNGSAARLTLAGPITGSRGLTKSGNGIVALAGTNSFTGSTSIATGTLALDATAAFGGSAFLDVRSSATLDATALSGGLSLNANQTLAGSGSVLGDVSLNSASGLSPGATNGAGTLTLSNNLTFAGSANWNINLASSNTTGGGTNDLVVVAGNLSLAGANTISVNLLGGALASPGSYTILTYGGALAGGAANLTTTNATRYVLAPDDSTPGELRLNVTGNPTNLTWRGDGSLNRWDIAGSSNWINDGASDRFYQLDTVMFDDSGSNNTFINLFGSPSPTEVTVNGSKNYTFGGAGKLTGAMPLNKSGSATLTISNANDFTGAITVSGGVLKTANSNALGSAAGVTIITNAAVLDVNGMNLGAEPVTVSGAGAGNGAIINSGSSQQNALRFVTLAGDTTFGGANRWDIRANPTASLAGNGFKLTKTNANDVWLVSLGETSLSDIEVRQGLLGIQDTTTLGNKTNALVLWSGTTLNLWDNDGNVLDKKLRATNATIRSDSGDNTFAGSATLNSAMTFVVPANLEMSGPISGSGTITKSGAGMLILSGSNFYSGTLNIDSDSASANDGVVRLASSTALNGFASPIFIRNDNGGYSTLQLDGGIVVTQSVSLSGRNNTVPAIVNVTGSNYFAGGFSLTTGGTSYLFQSDSGTLNLGGALPASTPGGTRTLTFQGGANVFISGVLTNGSGGGTVPIIKNGAGTLTLANTNSYTGGTTLSRGNVQVNSSRAFGTGTITANPGANNARILLANGVTVTNAIVATTVNPAVGLGFLSCGENSTGTISGPITFSANSASGGHFAGPTTNGYLNITGPVTANATNILLVRVGNVRFSGGGSYSELQSRSQITSLGAANGIATNAVLDLAGNGSTTTPTRLDLNGFNQTLAGLKNAVNTGNAAWVTNSAATTNTLTLALGATNFTYGGSIVGRVGLTLNSGTQTLAKTGTSSLNGLYNFSGNTTLNGGRLVLGSGMTLPNTPVITVGSGATLDVSASGLTLTSAQTLRGNGAVTGNLGVNGTVSPGSNSIGTLTFSNNVAFNPSSTNLFELNKTLATNDQIVCLGTLSYGGRLVVTNLNGSFALGDSFRLFNAAGYGGSFAATNLPPLLPGQGWRFTPTNGTLSVVSTAATNPTNITVVLSDNTLQLSWPADHIGWHVETNAVDITDANSWFTFPGSTTTNQIFLPVDPARNNVFFRLTFP